MMPKDMQNSHRAHSGVMSLENRAVLARLNAVHNTIVANRHFPPPMGAGNMLPEQVKFVDTDATLSKKQKRSRSVRVPGLVSRNKGGGRYVRAGHIKEELRCVRALAASEWPERAGSLQNETLICLIRLTQDDNPDVSAALAGELSKRVKSRARKRARGKWKFDKEQFASNVEMRVLELVWSKEPSRQRDFLEVRFGSALKNLIEDLWSQFEDSAADFVEIRRWSPKRPDEQDGQISRDAVERVGDPAPGPEDTLLNLDVNNRRHRILQDALDAITDPQNRLAVILHHGHGIPIASSMRGKDCLTRRLRKDARHIKYCIDTGMREMRAAMATLGIHSIDSI
jgi:hypothetical protein